MIRHGKAPFLECSSGGDKRFSAFYAKINSKSIERRYQAFKVFPGGVTDLLPEAAKGRKAINQLEAAQFYSKLWDKYIHENSELLQVLRDASGLSDIFGQPGHCCQATELWRIRNTGIYHKIVQTDNFSRSGEDPGRDEKSILWPMPWEDAIEILSVLNRRITETSQHYYKIELPTYKLLEFKP